MQRQRQIGPRRDLMAQRANATGDTHSGDGHIPQPSPGKGPWLNGKKVKNIGDIIGKIRKKHENVNLMLVYH